MFTLHFNVVECPRQTSSCYQLHCSSYKQSSPLPASLFSVSLDVYKMKKSLPCHVTEKPESPLSIAKRKTPERPSVNI